MSRLSVCCKWECHKLLTVRRGWVIVLAVILLQLCIACFAKPAKQYTFDAQLYAEYVKKYAGEYSAENAEAIHTEKQKAAERMQPGDGVYTEEARNARLLASMQHNALSALEEKYSALAACKDKHPVLTYDLELTDYLRKFGVNWASLLGLLFLLPMLMLGDAQCGMEQILCPAQIGRRRLMAAKLAVAVLLSVSLTAVCAVLQYWVMAVRWNFGALDVPIQSITGFATCRLNLSVRSGMLMCALLRLPAAAAFAMLVGALSLLLRKTPAVISAAVLLVGIGAFLSEAFPELAACFLFAPLSGLNALRAASASDLLCMCGALLLKAAALRFLALHIRGR